MTLPELLNRDDKMLFSRWRFSKNKKVPVLTGTLDSKVFMEHRKEPRNIALLMEVL